MGIFAFCCVVLVVASILWERRHGGILPAPFGVRSCQGRQWRRAFPNAPEQDIREFLSLFVSAFVFRDTEKLKLGPDDSIMSVYRALYPSRWTPDALEVETLAQDLHKQYGVRLSLVWTGEDVTLGEVFAHVQQSSLPRSTPR